MKSVIVIIFGLFLHGCMSTKTTCINERTMGTIIRWGDGDMASGSFAGYEIHAEDLGVYSAQRMNANQAMNLKKIDSVNVEYFCKQLHDMIGTFTAIQSLYSPGTTYRSVEYINTKTNVQKKAIWNPEFSTYGSKEFRALHDSLMLTIPVSQ
ncbi:MAG: hypothetical protein RIT37_556 [Bacteroidota bacterium]